MMRWLPLCVAVSVAAVLLPAGAPASAQAWPAKPLKFIVPFPAGSATDSIARMVGQEMAQSLGQAIVVENKPGAGGSIAAEQVARSAPDGYTLLVGTNTQFAANVSLYRKLPYNPVVDFAPVARFTTQPTVLVVGTGFPAKTLAEFVGRARANPNKLSGGYGSASTQVVIAKLRGAAAIDVVDVPYKGIPQSVVDVIAGTLDFAVVDLGTGLTQARGGKVRALAVTSAQRSPLAPDWPAFAETYPGFDVFGWHALVAPAGTPSDIVQRLYEASAKAVAKKEIVEALANLGITPAPLNPDELGRFIKSDIAYWAELIKAAGIQPE